MAGVSVVHGRPTCEVVVQELPPLHDHHGEPLAGPIQRPVNGGTDATGIGQGAPHYALTELLYAVTGRELRRITWRVAGS